MFCIQIADDILPGNNLNRIAATTTTTTTNSQDGFNRFVRNDPIWIMRSINYNILLNNQKKIIIK